jgi:hypothetical protein
MDVTEFTWRKERELHLFWLWYSRGMDDDPKEYTEHVKLEKWEKMFEWFAEHLTDEERLYGN